jgi:hypothetical protein
MSPRHLPCVTVEEVLEGTRGCGIIGSGTTRVRFDISRAPDQDLRSKESCLRWKTIKFYKIQWRNHTVEEATWESEDFLCSHHPEFDLHGNVQLFAVPLGHFLLSNLRTRFCFGVGRGAVTPRVSNPHDYIDHVFKRS